MQQFLELFGEVRVVTVVCVVVAASFVAGVFIKCKKSVECWFQKKQEGKAKIDKIISQVEQYPVWRQQSIDIQKGYDKAISELKERQEENTRLLQELREENRKRSVNDLRNKLLQLHRYYSSKQKNPMQAWSEMEAKAFWDMFGDYEDAGGNGHMKTEVKPAMRRLEEIPMTETEKIKELMESRQ